MWHEQRPPDKTGVFSLWGIRYQVGPELARHRVEVRYDPEALDELAVWHNGRFLERVRPFEVRPHRRPKAESEPLQPKTPGDTTRPVADWLGSLVKKRRAQCFIEHSPAPNDNRAEQDQEILDLLFEQLAETVVQESTVRDYLRRYGPFDPELARQVIGRLLEQGRNDLHVTVYLDAIRKAHHGGSR